MRRALAKGMTAALMIPVPPARSTEAMPPNRPGPTDALPANRLRVGACAVDVPLREIVRADGAKTRVTVKSMAVLVLLAEHAGQVVSRDALLHSVWAGTMPTDDVVTQAVTLLRKALGDDRDAPAYVETIPKAGYRLLADVEWSRDAEAPMPEAPLPAGTMGDRRRGWAVALLGVATAAALAWGTLHWRKPQASPSEKAAADAPTTDLPYTLLTARPGPETQPALSPDGALVAYAMPPGAPEDAPAIFVQTAQPTPPRQLTAPPAGHSDHLPRWSPDGRQLMFARIDDTGGCELLLMPASGGATRAVGCCDRLNGRYDWLPDGTGIVAGLKPEGGAPARLSVLRLDSGQWRPMAYPADAGSVDFDPRFSPDGTRLGFRRGLSHSDLWAMPAAGGAPTRLTRLQGNITGWDWTPDGRALLFGFLGNPPQLFRHELASGLTRALGRFPASGLDVAARRSAMVFAVDDARVAMFRYPLPLRAGVRAEPLFASTGDDMLPSLSPDGRLLAFLSDRSREARLWLGEPDQPEHLRMIEGITPVARHPAQWSDDGRRLLVIGDAADADGVHRPRLYEVDAASGRSQVLAVADATPYFAQYLPDDRLLLVVDRGAGRLSLRIVAGTAPMRMVATLDDVGEARFDRDSGNVYFVRVGQPGLWRAGPDLRSPAPVDGGRPTGYWLRRWGVLAGRPFALRTAAPACLADWQWLGPGEQAAPGCLDPDRRGVPTQALMVSRDGKWLYAGMTAGQENSDIGLMDLDALKDLASATR